MLLREEMAWRVRVCAVVLGVAVMGIGLAPAARASDARHYEKVSPADKGNGDIVGDGGTNVASVSGDAVTMSTRTPFGDTVGSGVSGQTQYVARRMADGWATHSVTPTPRPEAYQTFFGATYYLAYSDDLRNAVVWGYDFPSVTGDLPLRNNIYVEDVATRALRPVSALQNGLPNPLPSDTGELSDPTDWGVSADARHVAFVSQAQYLPQAAPGVSNVYQWDDGVLSLAGILPDGTVPATGSDVVTTGTQTPQMYRAAMSADGTRLVFNASSGGNSQLFERIGGSRTAWISETEIDSRDPNYNPDPSDVALKAVSPDGRTVLFGTSTPLRPQDPSGGLYRWTDSADPSRDQNLTMIWPDGSVPVLGVSDDGERVYYHTGGNQLFIWDHGIATLIASRLRSANSIGEDYAVDAWGPGLGRLTPDGSYFAFATISPVRGSGLTTTTANGFREMYLYSLADQTLRCVSCPSDLATSDITVSPVVTAGVPSFVMQGIRPHFLSDGGKVFFSTDAALLPEDTNGVLDAYEYDPATASLTLVSSGKGSDPAAFTDAGASGDDVFVVTRQRLTASDHDDLVDVYDARIGDAIPDEAVQPATPGCLGETCQPPPTGSPAEDPFGSLTFDDGGVGAPDVGRLTARKRLVLHGAAGSLRVQLSAPGTLSWHGKGLRSGSVRRNRSGAFVLRLRLGRHARARLRASGTYTTSVHLSLASAAGDTTRTTRVVFKAAAKKGR